MLVFDALISLRTCLERIVDYSLKWSGSDILVVVVDLVENVKGDNPLCPR